MNRRRTLLVSLLVLTITVIGIVAFYGLRYFRWIYHTNTTESYERVVIRIPDGTTFSGLVDTLVNNGAILYERSFRWVASKMEFGDGSVKSGQYAIEPGMNNRQLIHMLRLGEQLPFQLILNNAHSVEAIAGSIGGQLEMDSLDFLNALETDFLPESEYNDATIMSMFIPNTYEVYWDTSPEDLIARLQSERERFWDGDRRAKAAAIGLNPTEVYILASIVEKETNFNSERPTIAGVYLNRLERGIPLQADPTVKFAVGDPELRRILYKHLEVDSPYNTYKNPGLPPGPIGMASIASIQGVLNAESHKYLYFCARPGSNQHVFSTTLAEHNRNAREYQRWLTSQGIR